MIKHNDEMFDSAAEIVKRLRQNGFLAYFAGGFTRDLILRRKIKDIDIATNAKPEHVEKIFEKTFETGKSFGVVNVLHRGFKFEIATFREEREYTDGRHPSIVLYTNDPVLDAARRDFTINSMYFSPEEGTILDFYNGLDDLSKGLIRAVGNPMERFSEDHLRVLRAIRFSAEYNFEIEEKTLEALKKCAPLLKKISSERIRDELEKMLLGANPAIAFRKLEENAILDIILPELSPMRNTEQDNDFHPEGDVMEHTILMLSHLVSPESELAWSVLLHDCGKPEAFFKGSDGRCRFYGHEESGAKKAAGILSSLKMPSKLISSVSEAVNQHMRISSVSKMREAKLRRLFSNNNFPLHLELHRIDCLSSHKIMDSYIFLLDKYFEYEAKPDLPKPLVTGKDLIDAGLTPSPDFQRILYELHNIQLENKEINKDDLLKHLKELI